MKRLFELTSRKALVCALAWLLSVALHNVLSGRYRAMSGGHGDEPIFFLLAVVVIPLYVLIAVSYTLVIRSTNPR